MYLFVCYEFSTKKVSIIAKLKTFFVTFMGLVEE